ncbi:hypothetical protein D3C83_03290 [compost metagenome]
MNWVSARCNRATWPFIRMKRAPLIFVADSKSRPSGVPTSTWSLTGKSNFPGSPLLRTSTLSSADLPARTLAWGTLGTPSRKSSSFFRISWSSCSFAFRRSACELTCAMSVEASSPFPFIWPTCFESWLRFACRS